MHLGSRILRLAFKATITSDFKQTNMSWLRQRCKRTHNRTHNMSSTLPKIRPKIGYIPIHEEWQCRNGSLMKKHCWIFSIRSELARTSWPYKTSFAVAAVMLLCLTVSLASFHLPGEKRSIWCAMQSNAPPDKFSGGGCTSPCPSLCRVLSKRRARAQSVC